MSFLDYELSSEFHFVSHKFRKYFISFYSIFYCNFLQQSFWLVGPCSAPTQLPGVVFCVVLLQEVLTEVTVEITPHGVDYIEDTALAIGGRGKVFIPHSPLPITLIRSAIASCWG